MVADSGSSRPVPVTAGRLECSSTQRRIWFMEQLHPGTSAYNLQLTLRIDGSLNVEVLRRCLDEIVRRHSVLRACFPIVDGWPCAVVAEQLTLPMPATCLIGRPDADAQAIELAAREALEPFDLEHGPLIRARIIQVTADRHLLCWTTHHIVADDRSHWLMMRELALLYPAISAGQPSPLPSLPLQYWDYVSWQRSQLQDPATKRELAYWRQTLADAPLTSTLPPDVPRSAAPVFRGSRRSYALPAGLTSAVDEFARRERVTPFMVLLAGVQALLHRCSGQDDIVIGVPTAGRDRAEFEELVGPFVNTLPIRGTLAESMPFRELLHRVRTVAIEAYQHQEVPFDRLVEELRPPRRASVHPLFQVMLVAVQDAPFGVSELPGLTVTTVPLDVAPADRQLCTVLLDLTLCLRREGSQFAGYLEYNSALLHSATAERLLQSFTGLLERAVADPDLPLARLISVPPKLVHRRAATADQPSGRERQRSARDREGPPEAIDLALRALAARSR
jgi:hypothetical protein